MHRRWLTAIGGGTVLLVVGLAIATVASGVADPIFLVVLALWTLGGLGWVAAGQGWAVPDLEWYQHVGVGVGLVAAGMAVLAAQTLLVGDNVVGGMQGMVAVILLIQAVNHYRGGNITQIVDT
jgi:hypothetical protein